MKYYFLGGGLSLLLLGALWSFNHISAPFTILTLAVLLPIIAKIIYNQTKPKKEK